MKKPPIDMDKFQKDVVEIKKLNTLITEMMNLNYPEGIHGRIMITVLVGNLQAIAEKMKMSNAELLKLIKHMIEAQ